MEPTESNPLDGFRKGDHCAFDQGVFFVTSAINRPHRPIKHDVRQATRAELIVGREFKRFSDVGILRHVWLCSLSECGRYALISYKKHGRKHDCATSELLVFQGFKQ